MPDVYDVEVAAQSPAELRQALNLYQAAAPTRVLEIGTLYGGTLRVWLTYAQPGATVVAIDPNHLADDKYDGWCKEDTQLVVGFGQSQSAHMVALAEQYAPYDWVFIDGDHSDVAVVADAQLALRLTGPGGHILFHDILPPPSMGFGPTPPGQVYEALAKDYRAWAYVAPRPPGYPPESANGIGVVRV